MKTIIYILLIGFSINLSAQNMGEWTWMKGSTSQNSAGVFGTKGVPDINNYPPALYESCSWTDNDGNFWLFGGTGYFNGYALMYNTLWKYSPLNNTWTWVSGSDISSDLGNYGVKGVPSSTNCPPAKGYGVMSWIDKNNCLWLFSGCSPNSNVSDLWKYDISTNEWTWMSGSNSSNIASYGTKGVPSINNCPPNITENNCTWVDNLNNLWFFGGATNDPNGLLLFCNDLWKYNSSSNEWTWVFGSATGNVPPVFGQKGVANANNDPGGRSSYSTFIDNDGNLSMFGSGSNFWGFTGIGGMLNDIWKYNINDNNWTWTSGENTYLSQGTYGNVCEADNTFAPASRYEVRSSWTDSCGFWIYGGFANGSADGYSDFWRYDYYTNTWTRINGTSNLNLQTVYGTIEVSSPTNTPGARGGAASWIDKFGHLWMFGGLLNSNYYGDLWRFIPDSNCVKLCTKSPQPYIPIKQEEIPVLEIPNVFTPNSDNINDGFNIIAKNYKSYQLTVYNRWGLIVFESSDNNVLWNGNYMNTGEKCTDGVYYYLLNLTDKKEKKSMHKGFVTIIK
ncbi:MAG: gliding motility-associated C-terminal domain-containing protein [Bacteroidota bacterium]